MRRATVTLLFAAAAIGVAWTGANARPVIIYNPSNSVPPGFYTRDADGPRVGAFVTVTAVNVAPDYAATRGYTDRTDRFLKRVVAAEGQVVCAEGEVVSIDGARVASRIELDAHGRTLPTWRGCHRLAADEVFLLGDTEDSFDGRYWGPTPMRFIDAAWLPF